MTSPASWRNIICFSHCGPDFIYCFDMPDVCPICHSDVVLSPMAVPPFLLRPPSTVERDPCTPSVLIKPACGKSFLGEYEDNDGLHCGIKDELGYVYDFDEEGLHHSNMSNQNWHHAISIQLNWRKDHAFHDSIKESSSQWIQSGNQYHSDERNCFSFVLWVLNRLGLYVGYTAESFIAEFILPVTTDLSRYITLYRKLTQCEGIYVSKVQTRNSLTASNSNSA